MGAKSVKLPPPSWVTPYVMGRSFSYSLVACFRHRGHLFQRFQALRQQDYVGLIDRSHRDRREDGARIVDDGNDLVALLMFVARVANPIAPFLATVLVPSPWSTVRSRCFSAARCRTLATNARQSDPSSAHLAKTL